MKPTTLALTLMLACIAACESSIKGSIPIIEPRPNANAALDNGYGRSLKPVFRWKDQGVGSTYDIALWDAVAEQGTLPSPTMYAVGNRIYFREGLKEPYHQLEITLYPLKVYFWSVRLSGHTKWSTYNYANRYFFYDNCMAMFKTPIGE